jgi:tetratricopeptide (TPR) repeat protein
MKSIKRQFFFLTLLLAAMLLAACTTTAERRQMAALMAEADSMNRNYITFTTDSVMRRVTRFYDRHGTPNEQLHAYYLLGSVYRDLGEAPQALATFQEAIDRADTTATDCDYKLLAKVHGQMGALFQQQALYRNAIAEYHQVERYALIAGDTLNAILGYGHTASCYYNLGIEDTTLLISQQTRQRLMAIGKEESASTFLSHPIYIHLSKGRYDDAKTLIDQYEYHSTLSGRDTFAYKNYYLLYYYKGLYHLGTNRLDSASACFRKLAVEGATINNKGLGYSGLFDVYKRQNEKDSIVKYAELYKNCVDSVLKVAEQSRLQSIQGLYNYTRHQQQAQAAKLSAAHTRLVAGTVLAAMLLALAVTFHFYWRNRQRRRQAQRNYEQNLMLLQKANNELQQLNQHRDDLSDLISEKEKEIGRLSAQIAEHEQKAKTDNGIETTEIYAYFHKAGNNGTSPSSDDWDKLFATMARLQPEFHTFMATQRHLLNKTEYLTCYLLRLGIKPKSISYMLGVKPSYISSIRADMLKKLFAVSGKPADFDKRLRDIC